MSKELRRPTCCTLPIEALGTQRQGAKPGGTLALRGGRDFGLVTLAKPATLDVGFIGKMGRIDTEDFYGPLCLADVLAAKMAT